MNIVQQTAKNENWVDESKTTIPYNRITALEKLREKTAFKIAKEAAAISSKLSAFKASVAKECALIYQESMKDALKAGKGNFTWYNFDASIKIEVQINEQITFEATGIEKAKQLLDAMISESISHDKAFVKELVLSAFATSRGQLDTKKVLGLKKHASRIADERYAQAMRLIDDSILRPSSKTYFRVWVRNTEGAYEAIELNFSNI
jgi:hypothetical protein